MKPRRLVLLTIGLGVVLFSIGAALRAWEEQPTALPTDGPSMLRAIQRQFYGGAPVEVVEAFVASDPFQVRQRGKPAHEIGAIPPTSQRHECSQRRAA